MKVQGGSTMPCSIFCSYTLALAQLPLSPVVMKASADCHFSDIEHIGVAVHCTLGGGLHGLQQIIFFLEPSTQEIQ